MNTKLKSGLLVGTILALPLMLPMAAHAQPVSGLYVGGGVGANLMQDENLRSSTIAGATVNLGKTKQQMNTGVRGLASVGWGFGNGLRVEVEADYFNNGIGNVGRANNGGVGSGFTSYAVTTKGQEQKVGGFVNVLYDINPAMFGMPTFPLTPYVGVGAGYLQAYDTGVKYSNYNNFLTRDQSSQGNFAYQGIIGVAYPITSVPGLALTGEYRFTGMADNRNFKTQYFAPGVTAGGRLSEAQDYNHSLMLGVRYAFNAAPPPPPPAPVPVAAPMASPARTYLVFFDWDRADLTERARQIIGNAAQASTRVSYTKIEVDGNADRTGTAAYNQALSLRRAQTVAAELVRDGVPQTAINIQAFGDSKPLVPTAAGVREPQNRRVEIILR